MSKQLDELVDHIVELRKINESFARMSEQLGRSKNGFTAFAAFFDEIQYGPKSFTPADFNKRWRRLTEQAKIEYVLHLIS